MNLIPQVKHLETLGGFLSKKSLCIKACSLDPRLIKALNTLPINPSGTTLDISVEAECGEAYELTIKENRVCIHADGPAGAFYAIQTLRQIYYEERVPCLYIKDQPDFSYRGFYHDVTRGKIANVQSIKKLIDEMAFYKLNSLQLYVEHVFEFEETKGLLDSTGCMTKEELNEIGAYCHDHFIDFVPSLSTFGHMFEILEQNQYRHLRVARDFEASANFWWDRMHHHTINPFMPESFELVKSLIDQYAPCFTSDTFNICCDETYDLKHYETEGLDVGVAYLGFVNKIISYVRSLDKKIMMWSDILLQYPEVISELPEDTFFLNWYYRDNLEVMEKMISQFAELNRKQIVCPGTTTWNRFCENVDMEEINITKMIEIGHKYGAVGVLNTNWGDWGNICSMELGMYGMVLGAAKAWTVNTELDEHFYSAVNSLLYQYEFGIEMLRRVSRLHANLKWMDVAKHYFYSRFGEGTEPAFPDIETVIGIQKDYLEIYSQLTNSVWGNDEYRKEMLIAAEGMCVMAELCGKLAGYEIERVTDTGDWLRRYKAKWLEKNKESELRNIVALFEYMEDRSCK